MMRPAVLARRGRRLAAQESVSAPWEWTHEWQAESLIASLPARLPADSGLVTKLSDNRWFMYTETGNSDLLGGAEDHTVELSPAALVEKLRAPPPGQFAYFTSPLQALFPALAERVSRAVQGPRFCSVWLASRGAGTRAHYDAFDNEFVHLGGRKRLRVWDPAQHQALHVFPDSHPKARKSQVDFDCVDAARFPNVAALAEPALDVVLEPGDAVAIPAFWFHELETLSETSLSVNVFTPSAVAALAGRALARPPPPHAGGAPELAALVSCLFNEALGEASGARFAADLLASRFQPLGLHPGEPPGPSAPTAPRAAVLPWVQALESISRAQATAPAGAGQGIVEIVAAHLAELWAVKGLGGPEAVAPVLAACAARQHEL